MPRRVTGPRPIAAAALAGAILLASPALALDFEPDDLSSAAVEATPIRRFSLLGNRAGSLTFRGGLRLDGEIESLSGLARLGTDRFVSVTDKGDWALVDLKRERGRLAGASVRTAPIAADIMGRRDKIDVDAEGVALAPDGTVLVAFESRPRVLRFGTDGRRLGSVPIRIPLDELRDNQGIEAIAVAEDGTALAITEYSIDKDGNAFAAVIAGTRTGVLKVRLTDGFRPTGATFLPDGDLALLERSFARLSLRMRVRRIARGDIRPGATLDGPALMEAGLSSEIDNMEGIAAHRDERGTVLTIVSDDNGSFLQRTLLLEFLLPDGAGVPTVPVPRMRPLQAAAAAASRPRSAP